MDQLNLSKIRAIYKSLLSVLKTIDPSDGYSISQGMINSYDQDMDELSMLTGDDYSRYKSSLYVHKGEYNGYWSKEFAVLLSKITGHLAGIYEFDAAQHVSPSTIITVDNTNKNEVNISYKTINQLIADVEDPEVVQKLAELNSLLSDSEKDVPKIRQVLSWLADKSWDVFIAVLPYMLGKLSS